jgi:uncharacterized membrane protein YidH (DUF202 family)
VLSEINVSLEQTMVKQSFAGNLLASIHSKLYKISMNKVRVLLIIILIGFVIVALPDSDNRLFSISKDHGPSLQDAIGLVLILFSYTWLIIEAWKQKEKILKYKNSTVFKAGLFLFGIGHGLIIASVINDYKYWWVYGIIILVVLQIAVFYLILK